MMEKYRKVATLVEVKCNPQKLDFMFHTKRSHKSFIRKTNKKNRNENPLRNRKLLCTDKRRKTVKSLRDAI